MVPCLYESYGGEGICVSRFETDAAMLGIGSMNMLLRASRKCPYMHLVSRGVEWRAYEPAPEDVGRTGVSRPTGCSARGLSLFRKVTRLLRRLFAEDRFAKCHCPRYHGELRPTRGMVQREGQWFCVALLGAEPPQRRGNVGFCPAEGAFAMKLSTSVIRWKQTPSFKLVGLMLATIPLGLMLSVAQKYAYAQTSESAALSTPAASTAPLASDWTGFHRDNMQRWNPHETALGINNVGRLNLKWKYAGYYSQFDLSSPAVVNGVVYFGSDDNRVYALSAKTGASCGVIPPAVR